MGFHRSTQRRPLSTRRTAAVLTAVGLVLSLGVVHSSEATVGDEPGPPGAAANSSPDAVGLSGALPQAEPDGNGPNAAAPILDSYIVILREGSTTPAGVRPLANRLAARHGGTVRRTWGDALLGFEAAMNVAAARRVAAEPHVAYVEQNRVVSVADTQEDPPSFGLDRIDQRGRRLDGEFVFSTTASDVHAYIIDTGIRLSHREFEDRAESGFDAIDGGQANDCNGHGTHVAGTVGGRSFGVAKGVNLVAVRVLDCDGLGTTAEVIAGVNFVTREAIKPAVANMSIGGGFRSRSLDAAVTNSIAAGVAYVAAAGNTNDDACRFSPTRIRDVVTVGATDRGDRRAPFSNIGACVDIFAPGVDITSASARSTGARRTLSGTSMAAPHVTGAVALLLAENPDLSPAQVRELLLDQASTGVVRNRGSDSPNRLLHIGS